jgi:hypothetical protein
VKLAAINLARTLAFIETVDLDPKGKLFFPDFVKAMADRYKFQTLPKFEERQEKGLIFEEGKISNKVIGKLQIFNALIVLETRSNTSDSKQLIEEMLLWGAAKFDFNYSPGAIKRFGYVSDVSFYSEVQLLGAGSRPLLELAAKTGAAVSEIWQESIPYYPSNLAVGHDPTTRKMGLAPFSITYRVDARWSENKYFSEAPLPTDLHLKLLEDFERGMIAAAIVG